MSVIGFVLTVFGAFLVANYRILSKQIMNRGESDEDRPAESVLNAGATTMSVIVLLALFLASGGEAGIGPEFWKAILIAGPLNIGISFCGLQALRREKASVVVPIFDTTPAVIVFTAMLVTGERPTTIGYLGILCLVLGTYTLNIHELVEQLHQGKWSVRAFFAPFLALGRSIGVRFAMAASAMGCFSIAYDGVAARNGNPFLAVACIMAFPAVAHTIRAIATGHGREFFDRERLMPWGAGIGAIYALAVGSYAWSFRYSLVSYQATVKRVETFIVLVLAFFILGERKNFRSRLVAVALMVLGTILITR